VNAAEVVIDAVRRVEFGPLTTFRNLSVLALSTADERESEYLTLDEALAQHVTRIAEVNEGGHVRELKIVNDGDRPVLLLDGEELLGAKQNRVLNLTILAPAHQISVIPVSCVESGRWQHVSPGFVAAPRAQFAEGRAAKMRQVTSALNARGSRSSDQQDVWSLIAEKSARMGAVSDPSAMSVIFDTFDGSLEEFVAAFPPVIDYDIFADIAHANKMEMTSASPDCRDKAGSVPVAFSREAGNAAIGSGHHLVSLGG
jgi:hypothetical protein